MGLPEDVPDEGPVMVAWPDTDGDGDDLHIRVREDGTNYEKLDKNLQLVAGHEQYAQYIQNAADVLLSLYNRAVGDDEDEREAEAAR